MGAFSLESVKEHGNSVHSTTIINCPIKNFPALKKSSGKSIPNTLP